MPDNSAFPVDPELTGIAIGYRNREMIADSVLPPIPAIGQSEFKWWYYPPEQSFTVPNTKVGRRSEVPEVNFEGEERTGSTEDWGLNHGLPQRDVDNAPEGSNPLGRVTEMLTQLIELDKEVRVAKQVFSASTYAAGNQVTLSSADKFSSADSDPLKLLLESLDAVIMRPNQITFGQGAWREFRMHPKVIKATNKNSGDAGAAAIEAVKELLEVQNIYVGRALVNTARPGQAANMQVAWGNHVALQYIDPLATNQFGTTFGYAVPYGNREAQQWFDKKIGLKGGTRVQVGESRTEIIAAPDLGYLIRDVI